MIFLQRGIIQAKSSYTIYNVIHIGQWSSGPQNIEAENAIIPAERRKSRCLRIILTDWKEAISVRTGFITGSTFRLQTKTANRDLAKHQ